MDRVTAAFLGMATLPLDDIITLFEDFLTDGAGIANNDFMAPYPCGINAIYAQQVLQYNIAVIPRIINIGVAADGCVAVKLGYEASGGGPVIGRRAQ